MSGIVGHSLYAVLGAKAAAHRGVGLAAIATRNRSASAAAPTKKDAGTVRTPL